MGPQPANHDGEDDESAGELSRYRLHEAFAGNVTLHGYRYLFDSNASILRRSVWCLLFFSALAFGIFLFVGVVQDYFMYKSFTVIEVDPAVEGGLNFPTLTFCYNEPFTVRHLRNLNISRNKDNNATTLSRSNVKDLQNLWNYLYRQGPRPHSLLKRILKKNKDQINAGRKMRPKILVKRATKENTGNSKKRKSTATKKRSRTQKRTEAYKVKKNKVKDNRIRKDKVEYKIKSKKEQNLKDESKKTKKKKNKDCDHVYIEKRSDYNSDYDYLLNLISTNNIRSFLTDPVAKQFLQDSQNKVRYETCRFGDAECRAEDLKMVQLATGQPCLQFNPYIPGQESLRQDKASPDAGFIAFLNIHGKDTKIYNKMRLNSLVGHGVYLMITPHGIPVDDDNQLKVMLQPGTLTMITLQGETVVEELPPPHGKCGRRDFSVIKPRYPYSNQMCLLDCNLQYPIHECRCVSREIKEMVKLDIPICSLYKMAKCWSIKRELGKSTSKAKECHKTCKSGCGHTEYTIRSETNKVGTGTQVRAIQKACNSSRVSKEIIEKNIVGVQVSFSSILRRRENVTPSATLMTLVGTIGGSMGLAAGFSLLTLMEFLLFLFDIIFHPCFSRLKASKARDKEMGTILSL